MGLCPELHTQPGVPQEAQGRAQPVTSALIKEEVPKEAFLIQMNALLGKTLPQFKRRQARGYTSLQPLLVASGTQMSISDR